MPKKFFCLDCGQMTAKKPGATRGGKRKGAGRPPKPDPLSWAVTVALTPATVEAIDTDIERLREEMPEATVERAGWIRTAIAEKLARRRS